MSESEGLVLQFIPALLSILLRAEELKGSPLTEDDVLRIRDGTNCIRVPQHLALAVDENRGYPDIDPENCWAAWQRVRLELGGAAGNE